MEAPKLKYEIDYIHVVAYLQSLHRVLSAGNDSEAVLNLRATLSSPINKEEIDKYEKEMIKLSNPKQDGKKENKKKD